MNRFLRRRTDCGAAPTAAVLARTYARLAAHWSVRRLIHRVILFFVACLLLFYAAMQTPAMGSLGLSAAFFIWISVFNYFVVSVFWSFMTDVFDNIAAKRLFGAIAAGGSKGVLVPPWVYEGSVAVTTSAQSPFKNLHALGKVGASVASATNHYRVAQTLFDIGEYGFSLDVLCPIP